MITTPISRMRIWTAAAAERIGCDLGDDNPALHEMLDEVAAAGGVEAWLEAHDGQS